MNALPDPYYVRPWTRPCRGAVQLPGSKSLTNRALILAALSAGELVLDGALFSRDSRILIVALRELGFAVEDLPEQQRIMVQGGAGHIPNARARIDVGNAGTAARFLTALVCLHPEGCFSFDGDEEMRRRPMSGLTEALAGLGARFDFHGEYGCFPFTVHTAGLPGGRWRVDASASSQMLSALLMVAPLAAAPVQLCSTGARPAFVEMTLQLMQRFGAQTSGSALDQLRVAKMTSYMPPAATFAIEPDVSAASYFISLPLAVGGELFIHGLKQDMLQGDLAFVEVMRHFGLRTETSPDGWLVRYGDAAHQPRRFDFRTFSDTFLTLAALAPLLPLPIAIDGIGHTRFQETDRIHAMTAGLTALGCEVIQADSSLEVVRFNYKNAVAVPLLETYRDHRVAMSFAIAGCRDLRGDGMPWLALKDPGCCAKTFPRFFHELESLYLKSHD